MADTTRPRKEKPFYFVIYIGPTGLNWTRFKITQKKPNPAHECRGEGNCLVFKMSNYDCSTEFHKAMLDGTIIKQIGERWHEIDASFVHAASPSSESKHE